MEIIFTNKFFTLRGSSKVTDPEGNPLFKVQGKFWTLTRKKYLQDLNGNNIYMIRNKFWVFLCRSAYIYDMEGNRIMQIKRKIAWKSKMRVLGYKEDMRIDGSFFGWSFDIIKNDKVVATVRRKLNITDKFSLIVEDESFAPLALAMLVAMDNIMDAERDDSTQYFD